MNVRTARQTGLFYLGLALTGGLGFLLIRPRLFTPDDADATLANVLANESLAHVDVALELGVVLTQALAAVWFYKLFRTVDAVAAGSITAFGLVNAVAILASAAFLTTAVDVATSGAEAATVQTLALVSGSFWDVGALFFGLWLIPMGTCVLRSRWMPRPLGWVLVVGGVGYIVSGFVSALAPGAGAVTMALTVLASVGEFWMIGYLLVRGVGRSAPDPVVVPA